MKTCVLLGILLALAACARAADGPGLFVHEWGTFTSLQDESGRSVGGINTDDEPVPSFVHDVASFLLLKPSEVPGFFFQGAPSCHPLVTMRLETPVLYFHGAPDFHGPVDVQVRFQGGWLTQFYPEAVATNPGISGSSFEGLTETTLSELSWRGLSLNEDDAVPATGQRVWLAPRNVEARTVGTPAGEREKFLFYRGVGHLDAPLRVVRTGEKLDLRPAAGAPPLGKLWLVDILPDGRSAFRTLERPGSVSAVFTEAEYSTASGEKLRDDLRAALIADGLFADEAEALLETWKLSYFKSAGERVFFLVPKEWTERTLPLTVSGAPPITRVMVGRIELITLTQRGILAKMAASPTAGLNEEIGNWSSQVSKQLHTPSVAGTEPPPLYALYLQLGRFRNALLLEAQARQPSETLGVFIKRFGLEPYNLSER